jgi:hypothetical protein
MCMGIVILLMILFIMSIAHSYYVDCKHLSQHRIGHYDSRVKKILISCRDAAIRGAIQGGLSGSLAEAFESAATWTLLGGTATAIAEQFNWNPRLILLPQH